MTVDTISIGANLAMAESRLGTATVLLDGEIVDANGTFAELLGEFSPQRVIGRNLGDWFLSPAEYKQLCDCAGERVVQMECSLQRGDGQFRHVSLCARLLPEDQAVLPARQIAMEDNTERRQLELQLQQAQKMEALGRLAGGVAHDFNNLLMVIRGTCELMLLRHNPDEALATRIQVIAKATDQGAQLTRQLLAFSRRQILQPKLIEINTHLREFETMLVRLIGEDVQVRLELSSEPLSTVMDAGQLHQVLMNLAVNARDAMQHGGCLTIASKPVRVTESDVRLHGSIALGNYIMISVCDTGIGIEAEAQQHIFEPFYTTKGYGTGLGLSTVYGILKQSHGGIRVESKVGQGTTFFVYLPAAESPVIAAPISITEAFSAKPGATLLLVEDEALVRNATAEFLALNGFHVLTASDGVEGLEVANQHPEIDLVITDIVMPRMPGIEMAQNIRACRPDVPLLFTSGYTDIPLELSRFAHSAMLHKPFALAEITRRINALLDSFDRQGSPALLEAQS